MNLAEERLKKLALFSLFLFTFSGVISLISVKLDITALRVWKEALIILLFGLSIGYVFFRNKIQTRKIIFFLLLLIPFFILYVLFSLSSNILLLVYQIKMDLVPLLFIFSLYFIIDRNNKNQDFYQKLIKLIIVTSIINSFAIYFESIFPESFMAALSIEDFNNSGGDSGVRLDNTLWGLRAMGTMTSFINSGTLTFFGLICLLEGKIYKGIKKWFFFIMLVSAMILTTYKSTMIALFFYFLVKPIYSMLSRINGAKFVYFFSAFIIFSVMAFTFNSMSVYRSLEATKYKDIAYNSIYLRVLQHNDIVGDMDDKGTFATGMGVGINGTSGPNKELKLNSKPLDSTYIYLMSNYGFIGVCLYILVLSLIMIYLCAYRLGVDNIAVVMLFYTIGVEFFINNIFANFPNNVIFYCVVFLSVYLKKDLIESTKNR